MTITALATPDDDEPRPAPVNPPVDVAELDALYRELDRLLRSADREGDGDRRD